MTLEEFDKLLASHDWGYEYSDDMRVWERGRANQNKLRRMADESPDHLSLFAAWSHGDREKRAVVRSALGVSNG